VELPGYQQDERVEKKLTTDCLQLKKQIVFSSN